MLGIIFDNIVRVSLFDFSQCGCSKRNFIECNCNRCFGFHHDYPVFVLYARPRHCVCPRCAPAIRADLRARSREESQHIYDCYCGRWPDHGAYYLAEFAPIFISRPARTQLLLLSHPRALCSRSQEMGFYHCPDGSALSTRKDNLAMQLPSSTSLQPLFSVQSFPVRWHSHHWSQLGPLRPLLHMASLLCYA